MPESVAKIKLFFSFHCCTGLGTKSPEELAPLLLPRFADTAAFQLSLFAVSLDFQALHKPIPLTGCRNQNIQPRWASELAPLTRASAKELAAADPSARDRPPAWSEPTSCFSQVAPERPRPSDDSWPVCRGMDLRLHERSPRFSLSDPSEES
jgi:hypothetical protein